MRTLTDSFRPRPLRGVAPLVDVHLPATSGPRPSAVLVHGGGFVAGRRDMSAMRHIARHLVGRGFAVASLDYRLAFRGGRLDEALDDVVTGYRWWLDQADRFELDPARVSLVGASAGGALSLLAASRVPCPHRVAGVYPVSDFTALLGGLPLASRLLLRTWDAERWRDRSPCRSFDVSAPLCLLHGTHDRMVDVSQTRRLAAWRRERGLPVRVHLYAGASHGFFRRPQEPPFDEAMGHLVGFLAS